MILFRKWARFNSFLRGSTQKILAATLIWMKWFCRLNPCNNHSKLKWKKVNNWQILSLNRQMQILKITYLTKQGRKQAWMNNSIDKNYTISDHFSITKTNNGPLFYLNSIWWSNVKFDIDLILNSCSVVRLGGVM